MKRTEEKAKNPGHAQEFLVFQIKSTKRQKKKSPVGNGEEVKSPFFSFFLFFQFKGKVKVQMLADENYFLSI